MVGIGGLGPLLLHCVLDVFLFSGVRNYVGQKEARTFIYGEDFAYLDGLCLCKDSIIDLFHWIICHMYILLQLVKLSSAKYLRRGAVKPALNLVPFGSSSNFQSSHCLCASHHPSPG